MKGKKFFKNVRKWKKERSLYVAFEYSNKP